MLGLRFCARAFFISVRGLSLVAASGGHSSSRCAGLSLLRPLLLRSTSSRRAGSVVVAHGLSCSAACGILAPQPGIEPTPAALEAQSLHHWTTREVPGISLLKEKKRFLEPSLKASQHRKAGQRGMSLQRRHRKRSWRGKLEVSK